MSVEVKRVLPADVETVFDAWTRAETMSRWFVVRPHWTARVACDFRVGGRYSVDMDRQDGTHAIVSGEYLEIDRPRRLVFTWNSALPDVTNTRVTITLRAVKDGTELTLTHELLPDTEHGHRHHSGWEGVLESLGAFITP